MTDAAFDVAAARVALAEVPGEMFWDAELFDGASQEDTADYVDGFNDARWSAEILAGHLSGALSEVDRLARDNDRLRRSLSDLVNDPELWIALLPVVRFRNRFYRERIYRCLERSRVTVVKLREMSLVELSQVRGVGTGTVFDLALAGLLSEQVFFQAVLQACASMSVTRIRSAFPGVQEDLDIILSAIRGVSDLSKIPDDIKLEMRAAAARVASSFRPPLVEDVNDRRPQLVSIARGGSGDG